MEIGDLIKVVFWVNKFSGCFDGWEGKFRVGETVRRFSSLTQPTKREDSFHLPPIEHIWDFISVWYSSALDSLKWRQNRSKKYKRAQRLNKTFLSPNPEKPWDEKIIKTVATLSIYIRPYVLIRRINLCDFPFVFALDFNQQSCVWKRVLSASINRRKSACRRQFRRRPNRNTLS